MASMRISITSSYNHSDSNIAQPVMKDIRFDAPRDLVSPEIYYIVLKSQLVIRTLVCIWGILGNVVNMCTFFRMGLEDSVTIVFFNLAISDLINLLVTLAATVAVMFQTAQRELRIVFYFNPFYAGVVAATFARTFLISTASITTFVAIQRCLCVVKPLQFKGAFTRFRSYAVMLAIWIFSLTSGLTYVSQFEFKKRTTPNTNTSVVVMTPRPARPYIRAFMTYGINVVFNPLCVFLVFVCVLIMARALKKSVEFRQAASNLDKVSKKKDPERAIHEAGGTKANDEVASSKSSSNSSRERQVIVQVSIVSTLFLISFTPAVIMAIASNSQAHFNLYKAMHYTFMTCVELRVTIECVNSAANFFIYYNYNSKFRSLCFKKKQ